MNTVVLTKISSLKQEDIQKHEIKHKEGRYLDTLSKMAYIIAQDLHQKTCMEQISAEQKAAVIATNSGPVESIKEFQARYADKGYRGINPGTFPNVMLSTSLYRITKELNLKGPSIPLFLSRNDMYQAVNYGKIQILKERCKSLIIVFVDENKRGFGISIENEKSAIERGLPIICKSNELLYPRSKQTVHESFKT